MLNVDSNFGTAIVAIIIMLFMRQAEGIVRTIFGFGNAKHLGDALASGALLLSSMKAASSTLEALNKGKGKSNKGGNSSSSSNSNKKPNLRDTNIQNTNYTTVQQASNNSNSNTRSSTTSRSSENNSTSASSQQSSSSTNSSSSSSRETAGASGTNNATPINTSTTSRQVEGKETQYNTQKIEEAQSKWKKALNAYAKGSAAVLETTLGVGLGGALGGNVTDMIAGAHFAKAGVNATKLGGQKVISGVRNNPYARNSRINKKTNNVINAYDDLAKEKNWNNERMLDETERVLNIKDTSTIKDEKLRHYAETVQDLRTEYEGRYQAPNDMVLDRVTKIQSKEIQ